MKQSHSEDEIFRIARAIDLSDERSAYLQQVCGDDSQLFERVQILSPRLSFQQSPSSFSAVGFLLGIAAFLAHAAEFKRRPLLRGLIVPHFCKSLPAISFAWFKRALADEKSDPIC